MIAKNNLKHVIDMKNINLSELSRQTGMAYSTVYNIVNKDYLDDIKFGSLVKITDALNIKISEIYKKKQEEIMEELRVGSNYEFLFGREGALFNINESGLDLTLRFHKPTKEEIEAIKNNDLKYYLTYIDGVIWLVWEFKDAKLIDTPYCATILKNKPVLQDVRDEEGYGLTITLGDCTNGKLEAIRYISLSTKVSKKLKEMVEKQPDFKKPDYYRLCQMQMMKYTTKDIKSRAIIYGKSTK